MQEFKNLCFVGGLIVSCLWMLVAGHSFSKNMPGNDTTTGYPVNLAVVEDLPELGFRVVQLTVPKKIKMNDINDYREIVLPAYSRTNIQLTNMSRNGKDVGFSLIQLHAYEYDVTLSYTKTVIKGQHLSGTNVGLILYEDGDLYAFNFNPHENVMVALVMLLYNKTAPIPGGCNLEFPVEISPIMNLTLRDTTIEVVTPPAGLARRYSDQCGKLKLVYESYYLSMPSYDFSQRTYFAYIIKLISYASAKASGRINNLSSTDPSIKRVYNLQVGRGMVFVTLAIDPVDMFQSALRSLSAPPFLG
ncbi:transmembrane 7 superfamily member 3-like isoform X2 [Uranotaenia lowii]|uniref:transmembrane 7 superfamily member 3-like isoform X2 n=1 Tax=Uranotaenia lowii TaxID=190385 RepID=UPI00247A73C2|nr:transmembrane 7 superfamily member 3-like isoform X2 [Uranotaenia lowii]